MHPLQDHYAELDSALTGLLQRHETALSPESSAWVREMLDHGEYGLAFEALRDGLGSGHEDEAATLERVARKMGMASAVDESRLHERALAETNDHAALEMWVELGARGNPDAADRLREYARCDAPELSRPARDALESMGLSHEDPMP